MHVQDLGDGHITGMQSSQMQCKARTMKAAVVSQVNPPQVYGRRRRKQKPNKHPLSSDSKDRDASKRILPEAPNPPTPAHPSTCTSGKGGREQGKGSESRPRSQTRQLGAHDFIAFPPRLL